MHACPLRVDLEHRAGQQRWEHGDERGDSHGELGVLDRQPERHQHASGPERDDPQPQLPSPVQVGQRRREGVFKLAKKRRQVSPSASSRGTDGQVTESVPFATNMRCPATSLLGANRDALAPRTPVRPPPGQPGWARSGFVRIHGGFPTTEQEMHSPLCVPGNQCAGNVCEPDRQ